MPLSLLTVNVGAPSVERAQRQLRWLAARPEEVLVLTETKATAGSALLAEAFAAAKADAFERMGEFFSTATQSCRRTEAARILASPPSTA